MSLIFLDAKMEDTILASVTCMTPIYTQLLKVQEFCSLLHLVSILSWRIIRTRHNNTIQIKIRANKGSRWGQRTASGIWLHQWSRFCFLNNAFMQKKKKYWTGNRILKLNGYWIICAFFWRNTDSQLFKISLPITLKACLVWLKFQMRTQLLNEIVKVLTSYEVFLGDSSTGENVVCLMLLPVK